MNFSHEIVLASTSPRRSQLLAEAKVAFRIATVPVEEIHDVSMPLTRLTRLNAEIKARSVAEQYPRSIVLGADTLVSVDDAALGKPANVTEAHAMLRMLSGRSHQVGTSVCLVHHQSLRAVQFDVVTHVIFKRLSDDTIASYLSLIEPMDKAGGYAAQDHGDRIIDHMEGSLTNVVGLPMERLLVELECFEQALTAISPGFQFP